MAKDDDKKDKPGSRNITTHNQRGGTNITGDIHINAEDRSLKRRIRDVLQEADPAILEHIDAGEETLNFRVTKGQFDKLEKLLAENGSAGLVTKADRGPSIYGSKLDNGSLGPKTSQAEQIPMSVSFKASIRA